MRIDGNAVRMGMVLDHNNKLWLVVKHELRTPGNLRAFNQVELKDLKTGTKDNVRLSSTEKVERVTLNSRECNFLFADDDMLTFMDNENYEQFTMNKSMIGQQLPYLQDGMTVLVECHETTPLSVKLPPKVTLAITEADPVVKGQTASSSYKPAMMENGVRVMVPPFISSGEKIVVDTASGEYVERAKKLMVSPLINVMTEAAVKAGKGLLRDFGEVDNLQVSRKGSHSFVTNADIRTEKLLHRELLKARPDFGFLMEESGEIPGKDESHRWIVDPLDGTSNFIHAIPYFCISIGLEKREHDGRTHMLAGVIYDPLHNEMFTAEQYGGAFLNSRRLVTAGRGKLSEAMLVCSGPKHLASRTEKEIQVFGKLTNSGACIRRFGATALDLAHIAAGRVDGGFYDMIQPWDIAAGALMIKEAGGLLVDFTGKSADLSSRTMIASSGALAPALHKLSTA